MEKVKYSTQNILTRVREIILNENSNKEIALRNISYRKNIPIEKLTVFFNDYDFLSLDMYKTSAKLLDVSLEEITLIENINVEDVIETVKCREKNNIKTKKEQEKFLDLNKYNIKIFSNIIDILKLGGESYE